MPQLTAERRESSNREDAKCPARAPPATQQPRPREGSRGKERKGAKAQRGAPTQPVIPRKPKADEGSASTKALPPPGQIPPLAALAFGMTGWWWALAFGKTGELRRAFHCERESRARSAVGIVPKRTDS